MLRLYLGDGPKVIVTLGGLINRNTFVDRDWSQSIEIDFDEQLLGSASSLFPLKFAFTVRQSWLFFDGAGWERENDSMLVRLFF